MQFLPRYCHRDVVVKVEYFATNANFLTLQQEEFYDYFSSQEIICALYLCPVGAVPLGIGTGLYNVFFGKITLLVTSWSMAFAPVNTILDGIQAQANWTKHRLWLKICRHWQDAVGEAVAIHTCPTGIYRHVLQVAVSSGVWAQSLSFERRSILQKLHLLIEDDSIVDIHFSTARWEKVYSRTNKGKSIEQPKEDLPKTPQEAIDRCMVVLQKQKAFKYRCPQCGAPASQLEIDRWQMCHNCACRYLFSGR